MNFSLKLYRKYQQEISSIYDLKPINLDIFETIPSTNQKLWELLDCGENPSFAAVALQQTAGRGQWGKTWLSSQGGLYLSVILQPNITLNNSFHLTMATAWGIAAILRSYGFPIFIKWSNDLILNQRKLGGIKLETRCQKNLIKYAVIGVGINWINPVPDLGINLQAFCQETGQQNFSSLEKLAAVAIAGILLGYDKYLALGADYILDSYQNLLDSIGRTINLDGKVGTITGVTEKGQLQVKLEPGEQIKDTIYVAPGQITLGYDYR